MAPPMAAVALGRAAFTVADLVAELAWPDGVDVGLIEGAGGYAQPLAADGDAVDLLDAVGPDLVVLVVDAGLGTLHLVRMSADAIGQLALVVHRVTVESDVEQLSHRLCHPESDPVMGYHRFPPGSPSSMATRGGRADCRPLRRMAALAGFPIP